VKKLVIATRRSRLALWQAEHVATLLKQWHAGLDVELLPLSTRGDELIDRRLDQAGGKGLFVQELENAMAGGRADLAVHSMKDVPADLPQGFAIAAITAREDARDVFLSQKFKLLREMPAGATLGTSSLRRSAQIVERFPELRIRLLRGNVDTRLAKLERLVPRDEPIYRHAEGNSDSHLKTSFFGPSLSVLISEGETEVKCVLPRLPLPRGRFCVWAGIFDDRDNDIVPWHPSVYFDVFGPALDTPPRGLLRLAPVHVDAAWEVGNH
jgi:porphobilinogen deaminase